MLVVKVMESHGMLVVKVMGSHGITVGGKCKIPEIPESFN